jgi:hypothetical protein
MAVAGGLASFDVGTNFVPRDMPAMIHQGEGIIPKYDNAALHSALDKINGGATGGGGDTHLHLSVTAMDGRSVLQAIRDNADAITKVIAKAMNEPGNRPAY